jgi:hypothetical protein
MKTNTKLLIGIGIAAAATTAIAYGVYRELKAIRNLTIDVDDLPEEDDALEEPEAAEEETEEEPAAEAAEEVVAD